MTSSHTQRLARAHCSLQGLLVGDALGGFFEGLSTPHAWVAQRRVPAGPWHYTDDTEMALSVYSVLRQRKKIDQDMLAASFAEHYQRSRGYGPGARALLTRIRAGGDWSLEARSIFGGQGSYGNGGAMRVAPLGAYYADDLATLLAQAGYSAEVTHAHPEGVAGAQAVALAAAWAWRQAGRDAEADPSGMFALLLEHLPDSEVRRQIERASRVTGETSAAEAAALLGNGRQVSAQDTVPFALWCAAHRLASYEEAIWLTLSGAGDSDTTCAIVGGVVALATGADAIPAAWLSACEPLPEWALG